MFLTSGYLGRVDIEIPQLTKLTQQSAILRLGEIFLLAGPAIPHEEVVTVRVLLNNQNKTKEEIEKEDFDVKMKALEMAATLGLDQPQSSQESDQKTSSKYLH